MRLIDRLEKDWLVRRLSRKGREVTGLYEWVADQIEATGSRLLVVDGRLQSEQGVIHVVADRLTDHTAWLGRLSQAALPAPSEPAAAQTNGGAAEKFGTPPSLAGAARAAVPPPAEAPARRAAGAMPKGRNFH